MINVLFFLYKNASHVVNARSSQIIFLFMTLMLYSTAGYMYFELPENPDLRWIDAFWWSIVTMTTVGYGDFSPVTMWGRVLVGFPTMLLGVGILGYMLSLVATTMLESKMLETKGMKDVILKNHIIICNFNSVEKTQQLIHEIHKDVSTQDAHIVIIDNKLDELPSELTSEKIHFVKGDPSREATLDQASLKECRAVLIQADKSDIAGSDNTNLKTCLTIETIHPDAYTVVECINPENAIFFRRAKCDSVISIASLTGQMMIQELQDPGVNTIISELTSNAKGKQIYISKLKTQANNYRDVQDMYSGDEVILIGIRRDGENFVMPESGFPVRIGDQVILISGRRPT